MCTLQKKQDGCGKSANEGRFAYKWVNKKILQFGQKWKNPQVVLQIQWKTQELSVYRAKAVSIHTGKKNEYHEGNPCTNSSGGLVPC